MYDYDATCDYCHRPIDISQDYVTITQNVESLEAGEIVVSDSTEIATFCSQECCEEALRRAPLNATG